MRAAIREKKERDFTQVNVTSKVDVMINDIGKILEDGADELGRTPKIIIYSNFPGSFDRLQDYLQMNEIRYAYVVLQYCVAPTHDVCPAESQLAEPRMGATCRI
jgi:hypothetical protein